MKSLVTYFSCSGRTRKAANIIGEYLNTEVVEIKPEVLYTPKDLNWKDKQSRSTIEMHNLDIRPKIVNEPIDLTDIDTIYVGFPIWWYIAPTVVNTFLEMLDLTGKTIILFGTAVESDLGETAKYLENSAKGATLIEGKVFKGNINKDEIIEWLESL